MRILVIPPHDLTRHPIPNRLYHVFSRLADKHEVCLFPFPKHPLAQRTKLRGRRLIEVYYDAIPAPGVASYYLLNYEKMRNALRSVVPDEDVVFHANILPSRLAVSLCNKYGIPAIYDYLDHFPESAASYYNPKPLRLLTHVLVNKIVQENLRRSAAVVTPSHALRSSVKKFVASKPVYIIPNGVDENAFRPLPKERCREKLGLDLDAKLLLFFGSWDSWLDFDPVYATAKGLGCKFVVTGMSHSKLGQRQREALSLRSDDMFAFLGMLPDEVMPYVVNAADIVLTPYRRLLKNFGVPLKIVEALACGTPVLTSYIPEFRFWFGDLVNYYTNTRDIPGLVAEMFKNHDGIRRFLLNHRGDIVERFSWGKIATEYEKVLMEVVRRGEGRSC